MRPKAKRLINGGGHGRASKGANTSACNVEKDFEEDFHEDVGHQIIDDIYMPPPPKHPNLTGNQLGERLIIVDIEITNFKSYGGTVVLGPFHKAFNSIVGPNGSGKSNVIDSMLFVFGYRASKIRSAKISNIIHYSDTMPNCTYAKVQVNFAMLNDKGGLDHEIIPNSNFSISRVVEKNNNSYYMIDGSRVGFRDVSKKLEEFAIDLRYNRFLILQGEVEQISLMKPKGENEGDTGMLEFLEDIIGTSRYKLPIKQLNDKYYALNEERTVYVNRVNLCQKELKTVSELKDEAVKALEMQNKIFIEKSKIYQLHIHEESCLLEADEAEFAQEQAKLDCLDERLKEANKQCEELEAQEKEKAGEWLKMKEDRDKLKATWEECNQKDYYLHKKGKATKKDIKKLSTQIEADEAKLEELKRAAEENNDDTETNRLEAERAKLEKEQEKIDEQLKEGTQAAQEECADLITERDALDGKLTQFKEETSGKKKARDEAENNLMVLTVQRDKAKTKVTGLETKLKHLNDETEEKRAKVARFEEELPRQRARIAEKTAVVGELEREHQQLETQLRTKRGELQTLVSEKDSAVSGDKVHKALMEEMRQGRLQGIFGKLGALGAIDEKYDVAASTASGRLRNYVVDTSENAKAANRFLKEFNRNRTNTAVVGELEREHQQLETQLRTKRGELQTLVSEKDSAVSGDKVHKALMEEMRQGRLQGIFGKLGALGAIDEKYDVAASTASGRLRNYVVDTSENAKAANRFLKEFNRNRANAGSVTFIILDKLGDWTRNYRSTRQYPEGVPRIFDLIRVNDQRFLPAFYFAFRDTLVADDLEQASRIGHSAERHRVISLKGELIETDGSISGGGRPCSGAIGTTVQQETAFDQQRINDLEAEMEELSQLKGQLEPKIDTARRELNQLKNDLKVIEDNFAILNQDIQQNVSRIEQTAENLRNAKAEMERFENSPEIERAEAVYQEKREIYEREEAKMATEKEKLDELNEEINTKLITQLEPFKKQKKALEKKMKELVAKINSIASDRKNCELQLKKLEDDLETSRATIAQQKEELEKIEEEKTKVTEAGVEANNLYEQAMKDVEELGKTLEQMRKKAKHLEEAMKKANSEMVDVGHELDKKQKVLDEKRKKKNEYCARLADIVLNQIDLDSDDENEEDDEEEDEEDEGEDGEGTEKAIAANGEATPTENGVDGEQQQQSNGDAMDVDQEIGAANGDIADSDAQTDQVNPADSSNDKENGGKQKGKKKTRKERPLAVIPKLSAEELDELNVDSVRAKIKRLESEFSKLNPNYAAIEDYKRAREDFRAKSTDLENATSRRDLYMEHMKQTKEMRLKEFKTGYHSIAHKLKELYRTITLGGDADLEFVDSLDPFSEGINFAVRPNKKSWKNNINLSGGEKTLSSLALIFALHYYKPSPLYIMDEIDAALDFKNVSIIANYIKQRTRNTQFLIISLRSNMYEQAEMLIGVYKTFSVSKTLALDPGAYEHRQKYHGTQSTFSSQPTYSSQPPTGSSQQQQSQQSQQSVNNSSKTEKKPPPPPPSATLSSSQASSVDPQPPPKDAPFSPPARAPPIAKEVPASQPSLPQPSPPPLSPPSPPSPPLRQDPESSYNSEEDGDLMDLT
ncbi:PREDICTED: structural maintenance of chromosomes protein 4-like [Rhagoletis zephyria]|uniref:structural maintenance of chromosomes protein 4-like n=1 Tax=Rhagoletis zephyria TaxID=28612 RepID=UPI00081165A0|nr:PREDICTED: structural maintenance of chromosomes protein 4-like [Rhagoletis zephyria]